MHQTHRFSQQNQDRSIQLKRYTPRSPKPNNKSRTKLLMLRKQIKEHFLTDPHTSDNTAKSSEQTTCIKLQMLQQKLRRFSKQNFELKETIINMKANQFYTINEDKVKQAIHQNQNLRKELKEAQKQIQELRVQNQFLDRNNKHLKEKIQQMTQQNVRKSVDLTNSRSRQSTTRVINQKNNIEAKGNPVFDSMKKYQYSQRGALNHAKSNPNLYKQTNYISTVNYSSKQKFNLANKKSIKDQIQRLNDDQLLRKSYNKVYHVQQRLQMQQNEQRRVEVDYKPLTPRNQNSQHILSTSQQKSRSKEISLQAILSQKKSGYQRKEYKIPNQNFNDDYFIGKTTNHDGSTGTINYCPNGILKNSKSKRYL